MKHTWRHRPWRGAEDTVKDFVFWLRLWGNMLSFLMPCPLRTITELGKYGLIRDYFSIPAKADEYTAQNRGEALREKHGEITLGVKNVLENIRTVLRPELYPPDNTVWVDSAAANLIMRGFPEFRAVSVPVVSAVFSGREKILPHAGRCSIVCRETDKIFLPPPVFVLNKNNCMECIRFAEAQTGRKFDWDAFAESLREQNDIPPELKKIFNG